jgi:adenylosuccinate synthase
MTVTIVGSQLGDEGKGGIVDVFGNAADIVVRYQGGDNAGHTVVHGDQEYALSLVPSGAVRGKVGVLGNGCVVNPDTLFTELDTLHDRGLDPNIKIAERAHAILPYHRVLDGVEEEEKGEELSAGTTGRGIGPTYEDKAGRRGVRIGDLLDADVLRTRLEYAVPQKRRQMRSFGFDPDAERFEGAFDIETLFQTYQSYGNRIASDEMAVNCGAYLAERRKAGDRIMFEGAQGTSLDIDHGSYPYVTSSNPSAGAAAVGTGLGPTVIGKGEVIGIIKGYLSRVGTGPLPTELGFVEGQTPSNGGDRSAAAEELATYIRDEGGEYGTVTGRPRRVGWLDVPMLRHAARANGFTGLAVNHLDVLSGMEEIMVGHSYTLNGTELFTMPATTAKWAECQANYRSFDGWDNTDWAAVAAEGYDAIPANAQTYLSYLESELDAPVYCVGVGPGRDETVILQSPWE